MREIKFRVWDRVLGMWCIYKPHPEYHIHLYYSTRDDGVTGNSEFQYCIESDDFDVMQYAGLKDKGGLTDIYEGDIIDGTTGEVKGNIYECPKAQVYESQEFAKLGFDIVVKEMGTRAWRNTESALVELGCKYAQ